MASATVTVTIPGNSGARFSDLPEFRTAIHSYAALIDAIDLASPRRVPKPVIGALDRLREDLASLGELHLAVAAVRAY
jgi:hypothetical protein